MKKMILTFSFFAITILAFASYRCTGSFQTSCGEWNYIIHANDVGDFLDRYDRLEAAAERACSTGAKAVYC